MAKVTIIKSNGLVITNAAIQVAATSKPNALMRALEAMERHTRRTGEIFSVENYTTKQDTGSNIYYTVSVF